MIAAYAVGVGGTAALVVHSWLAMRKAEARRARCGLACVIRLRRALSQNDIRALRLRFGQQELELARLVAATRHAGAVVALDPDLRAVERTGEVRQVLERRGQVREAHARKAGKVHVGSRLAADTGE